jgi:hypothetical protein
MVATMECPMAKRNDIPVKLDAEVVRVARIAAAYKEMSLAEYLSERLRPLVAQDVDDEHGKRMKKPAKKGRSEGAE